MNNYLIRLVQVFVLMISTNILMLGQDIIVFKTGEELEVKVSEISSNQVRYQKWNNLSGPSYVSTKSEIFMIKYSNRTKDVFNQNVNDSSSGSKSTDAVVDVARKHMESVISAESKGALKLIDFKKENGINRNIFGQQQYELSYILIVQAQKDIWKQSEGLFNTHWYWNSFHVQTGEADIYAQTFQNIQSKQYGLGSQIEIHGRISYMETDNGWFPADVNSFSSGYDNTSSRDLGITLILPKEAQSQTQLSAVDYFNMPKPEIDTYEGETIDSIRSGFGAMRYSNGDVYVGNWRGNLYDGQGKLRKASGEIYQGSWSTGLLNGEGTFYQDRGEGDFISYNGFFVQGVYQGQGTLQGKSGGLPWIGKGEYHNGKLYNGTFTSTNVSNQTLVSKYANGKVVGSYIK